MLKKRFLIAALSALLSLPLTAPASQAAGGLLTAIICPGDHAVVFHNASKAPREGAKATLVDTIYSLGNGWTADSNTTIGLGAENACGGGLSDFGSFNQTGVVTSELLTQIERDSGYAGSGYSYASLGIVIGSTRYSFINATNGDFFSNAPGLYIVDYGAGGSSLGGNDGYSSNCQFLSKVVSTSLPTLKASGKQVTCSAGAYKFEGLNSESAVEVGNYKFSLMTESGVVATANSTTGSASFDTGSLPKGVMIWCEVETAVNNRVSITKSTDDLSTLNTLKAELKQARRMANLDFLSKKISDLAAAQKTAQANYEMKLADKGIVVFLS